MTAFDDIDRVRTDPEAAVAMQERDILQGALLLDFAALGVRLKHQLETLAAHDVDVESKVQLLQALAGAGRSLARKPSRDHRPDQHESSGALTGGRKDTVKSPKVYL